MQLFITGTDTGVGKTMVSALLADLAIKQGLHTAYYKPIQTGTPFDQPPEDMQTVLSITKGRVKASCRYCFEPPVTPWVADPNETINWQVIQKDVQTYAQENQVLLVEGAGGLMVPINARQTMLDLIQTLGLPVLLVARSQLGTLNHTLLSLQALNAKQIPVLGILLNFYPEDLDAADLAEQTLLPALRVFVSEEIPIWTCTSGQSPQFNVSFSDIQTHYEMLQRSAHAQFSR